MKYRVYYHECCVNRKSYVGWTQKTLEKRWKEHCKSAREGSEFIFHKAIRKYGIDGWQHEILCESDSLKEIKELEIFWIDKKNSFFLDNNGYNMTKGGDGSNGFKHDEETKALLKEWVKSYIPMLIEKNSGESNPFFGKHHDDVAKAVIGEASTRQSQESRLRAKESRKWYKTTKEIRILISKNQRLTGRTFEEVLGKEAASKRKQNIIDGMKKAQTNGTYKNNGRRGGPKAQIRRCFIGWLKNSEFLVRKYS